MLYTIKGAKLLTKYVMAKKSDHKTFTFPLMETYMNVRLT